MIDLAIIRKLQTAGVPSDTLLSLILDDTAQPADKPEQQEQQEKPGKPAEQPNQPEKPEKREQSEQTDPVLAAIEKLTGVIQASNIINSSRGAAVIKTADDVLAEVYAGRKED